MIRSAVRKLLWIARVTSTVVGLAIMVALLLGVATAGLGATGGNFVLGKANSAGAVSKLTASIIGPALQLVNQSTASGATALGLNVTSGKPPLKVNATAGKATNLNADKLDGLDAARLAGTGDSAYRGGSSLCGFGGAPFTSTPPVSVGKHSLLFATARGRPRRTATPTPAPSWKWSCATPRTPPPWRARASPRRRSRPTAPT